MVVKRYHQWLLRGQTLKTCLTHESYHQWLLRGQTLKTCLTHEPYHQWLLRGQTLKTNEYNREKCSRYSAL